MANTSGNRDVATGRMVRLALIGMAVEIALFIVTRLGPALAPLMTAVYVIVAVLFLGAIWHTRHRAGVDRRHDERRRSRDSGL